MSSTALMWAATVAPVADVQEYAILLRMADEADEAGCGVWLATATIARDIHVSEKTVQRRLDAMQARGLIGEGDQRKVAHLRADRRPTVYDLLIPADCFFDLAKTNQRRADRGLPPLTPQNRPVQAPPGDDDRRKPRGDRGRKRPRKLVDNPEGGRAADERPTEEPAPDGGTTSPPATGGQPVHPSATGGLVVPDGVTGSPQRGDYQSPNPGIDPGIDPGAPTSPSRTSGSAHASAATETGTALGETDRATLTAACRAAAAARPGVPGWTVRQCGEAAQAALGAGHTPDAVAARLVELAHDKRCAFPTMLAADLAVDAARAVQAARPAPAAGGVDAGEEGLGEPGRYRHAPVVPPGVPRCNRHPDQPAGPACRLCGQEAVDAERERLDADAARQLAADAIAAARGGAGSGRRRPTSTTAPDPTAVAA